MSEEDQKIKAYCNKCTQETNHLTLTKHTETWEDANGAIWTHRHYKILKCKGCDEIHFSETEVFSEDIPFDPEEEFQPKVLAVYPPRLARKVPDWVDGLDLEIEFLLLETYSALHNNSHSLAAMGARAVLEQVMLTKIEDQHSFKQNVEKFIQEGHMQPNLKKPLLDALDVGSASIHRGYSPNTKTLSALFDVIEGILYSTCIIPDKATSINKATPKRKK